MSLGALPSNAPIPLSEITASLGYFEASGNVTLTTTAQSVAGTLTSAPAAGDYLIFAVFSFSPGSAYNAYFGRIQIASSEVARGYSSCTVVGGTSTVLNSASICYEALGVASGADMRLAVGKTGAGAGGICRAAGTSMTWVKVG